MINIIKKIVDNISLSYKNKEEEITYGFNTRIILTAKNCDYDGSVSRIVLANKTVLPGRVKLLEDNFPITINMSQHVFLNDNIEGKYNEVTGTSYTYNDHPTSLAICPHDYYTNTSYNSARPRDLPNTLFKKRKIGYWAVGNGAINTTMPDKSYQSHKTNTKLYNMIPFRLIPKDSNLPAAERRMYKFEVIYPEDHRLHGFKGYYLKRIEFITTNAGINIMVDKSPYIPKWADTVVNLEASVSGMYSNAFKGNKVQLNYVDLKMDINKNEFKEYYRQIDGTLENANISELALICGLDAKLKPNGLVPVEELDSSDSSYANDIETSEVYDAECFAHLTFDPFKVSRENSTISLEYRIFS